MRRVHKDFTNPPAALTSCSVHHMPSLLIHGSSHKFNKNCYHHAIVKDLRALYHEKCAYCESEINSGTNDEYVDHYRPKSVYFWLAYEWSNLLYICQKCNRYKSNHFPIGGPMVAVPPYPFCVLSDTLMTEDPLLLHPEVDNPEIHLTFDRDGNILPKSEKGQKTIEICRLNRDKLKENRKAVIKYLQEEFKRIIIVCQANHARIFLDWFFEKIQSLANDHMPYTLLVKEIVRRFDYFILDRVGIDQNELENIRNSHPGTYPENGVN